MTGTEALHNPPRTCWRRTAKSETLAAVLCLLVLSLAVPAAPRMASTAETPDTAAAFADTIHVVNTELWIQGHAITDSVVVCSYADGAIFIGGVPCQEPPRGDGRLPPELVQLFGGTPYAQSLVDSGTPRYEAAAAYREAYYELIERAQETLNTVGADSAQALLGSSPLVDLVEITRSGGIRIRVKGIPLWRTLRLGGQSPREFPPTPMSQAARTLFPLLKSACFNGGSARRLVLVSYGGVQQLSGNIADKARAQLAYVLREGKVSGAPEGPVAEGLLQEALLHVSH